MANTVFSQKRFQGISDYAKESANGQIPDTYYFARAINFRDDPQAITLLPRTLKESGGTVVDLLKWADLVPLSLISYFIGDSGNFYSRSTAGVWTNLFTVANSHGNGLTYFSGDDYVYYAADSTFGRYGPTQSSPQNYPNYLGSQGGVPQNTNSVTFVAASSQYAHAADSATLSITGSLTLEAYFKATTLPTVGNSMTLVGKWEETGNLRSYKLDLFGVSGYFGDGSDGGLTISSDTQESPIDSACTGTAGTQSLSATNSSFAVGQVVFIHQSRGTNAGQWERNTIQGYTAGTITLNTPLIGTYVSGAQVRVFKQYSGVTINSGKIYSPKPWNGTVGGIIGFLCSGTFTATGTLSADSSGFRGGAGNQGTAGGFSGEGNAGVSSVSLGGVANGNGGGGGRSDTGNRSPGGGGGANGQNGTQGSSSNGNTGGDGGNAYGSADLTTMVFGGGGGGGGKGDGTGGTPGTGGTGGGIIFVTGVTLTINGSITSAGAAGAAGSITSGGGGGGSGGSILLKCQTASLTSVSAFGALGGAASGGAGAGGSGGFGRIVLDYLTSYTGSSSPTLNAIQDNTLVTTTTIQARLGISDNGTNFEYLTQNLPTLTTGTWNRISAAWYAPSAVANFYLNAVLLGTSAGTKTSIDNNTSLLYVGADKTSVVTHFFNGEVDDIRIWANQQTTDQIFINNQIQVPITSPVLNAYYKLNGDYLDATTNANDLTAVNTPVFTTDVPFPAPTTRLDIDTQNTNTGQKYTLLTSISESTANKLPFTPINDPQASVGFYVDTKGTGDWTVTVHDEQNRVIANATILNANIPSAGFIEFFFSTPWRLINNKSYHMHLTVSTGTSKVVSGAVDDFTTAEYATYFGFLVTDTQFHPMVQFQYQPLGGVLTGAVIIGNERYIAVWDGTNYLPNFITFPPAWRIRCFGFWKEFLAIGMWRGGNIYDFDKGRVYFWDGIAPTFNFFIDVPDGQINALFGVGSDLYMFAGYRGELLDYQGGYMGAGGNSQSSKIKRLPLLQPTDYTEIYPGAFTMWRSLLHFGLFGSSNSTVMERGVYSFGTFNQFYPNALSYDYVISTGNFGNTVNVGLVFPVGQSLIIGWQDGISYGADIVNFSNPPAVSGEIRVLIKDDGAVWKEKLSLGVKADFLPLATGESVDAKISINRGDFTVSTPETTVDAESTILSVMNGRGREYQIGVDLYSTGTTSPTLIGLSLLRDTLKEETQF